MLGAALAVWIFDQQYRIDTPPPALPLYYWTNSWSWVQDDALTPNDDYLFALVQGARYLVPQQTVHTIWRVTRPDGERQFPLGNVSNSGLAPFTGPPGVVGCCVLVDFFAGGRRAGYKRLRGPWPDSLMRGSLWDSALISWLEQTGVPQMLDAPLCNRRGVLFDDFVVRSEIYPWQQRHGSKRVARPVFVLPQ